MNHSFDVELATLYGIEEAIIIEYLAFWIKKNIANSKNFIEGEYWTYNSAKAFNELFPYMNSRKIARVLEGLESKKTIRSSNFNKAKYDRTKWYCIVDISIKNRYKIPINADNCSFDNLTNGIDNLSNGIDNLSNGFTKNVQPIPDINSDINTDINKDKKIDDNQSSLDDEKVEFRENFREYIKIASKATGLDIFKIEQVITPSLFRDIEISKVVSKIKESDFLQGLKENKPKITNFTNKNMINRIILDSYKNKEDKKTQNSTTVKPKIENYKSEVLNGFEL